ncbi:SWF/SNF helicase family protein [Iamia sp. SCSIO 61187]|uniref:helicase-related protein n=1 Tax=Iamia sp. SCSIO 61187 TaxID=2722752 RepID=UPI001C632A65|nr:helicase-related protein [Iamia sp. SCSIO 61187]QYG95213.1 SWF/SNF helicase family protein [Iamia sp. SCSIO 61187]
MNRFEAEPTLRGLKVFQRTTAEHVFRRMYTDPDPSRRFLVADEVGLGKTLITRGVIAQAVEHLQDKVDRIDVVYVCSNAQIARQNVRRLRIGIENDLAVLDRITKLPIVAGDLDAARRSSGEELRVNLVSFTPGTSFELRGGSGRSDERTVLRLLLSMVWDDRSWATKGSYRVFQGGVQSFDRFKQQCQRTRRDHGRTITGDFVAGLRNEIDREDIARVAAGAPTLRVEFDEVADRFAHERLHWKDRRRRNELVGAARACLARACLTSLEPDLIVLDEFQRFKHLLAAPGDEVSDAAALAQQLFDFVDEEADLEARVLLLSATPYKMLTTGLDTEDDHHEDMIQTAAFLMNHDGARVEELRSGLRDLRQGALLLGRDGGAAARSARTQVEDSLRRVMVRTERLAATPDRSGMLAPADDGGVQLRGDDIRRYVGAARLSRALGVGDPMDYWLSAPFLANFQSRYKLGQALGVAAEGGAGAPALVGGDLTGSGLLDHDAVERFDELAIDNPRMRWLVDDTVGRGAWRLLWMPPSLPYVEPSAAYADPALAGFTKRLVFSSWTMVPTAISTLVTYEAERKIVNAGSGRPAYRNSTEGRASRGRLLRMDVSGDRLTGLPVWTHLYPSTVLARIGDPLDLARSNGGQPVSVASASDAVRERLEVHLRALREDLDSEGVVVAEEGPVDERWYWAAPMWLDWLADKASTERFFDLGRKGIQDALTADDTDRGGEAAGLRQHLVEVIKAYWDYPATMGRPPDDLVDVLVAVAMGSPAVVAQRALARVTGRPVTDLDLRRSSLSLAWGFRTLFNGPEATEIVRAAHREEPYWRRVLRYSIAGNLQAVVDEFLAVLLPSLGEAHPGTEAALANLTANMFSVLHVRTVSYAVDRIEVDGDMCEVTTERMRANFALRLGTDATDEGSAMRESEVRDAFNSPFWPFVLATTSAGQEGLDFHHYCHAVVHWNLPGNPVDLEQREGRVHRFMGHAVRRNVALRHGDAGRRASGDPWRQLFALADKDRDPGEPEIRPWWVYAVDGGRMIERYVPALPLSRDRARSEQLRRAMGLYRRFGFHGGGAGVIVASWSQLGRPA